MVINKTYYTDQKCKLSNLNTMNLHMNDYLFLFTKVIELITISNFNKASLGFNRYDMGINHSALTYMDRQIDATGSILL